MARTTISIPDDLKRRMDAVQERINWSAVAAGAFEGKLREVTHQRRDLVLADVVERLRTTRDGEEQSEHAKGYTAGRDWAVSRADYGQLTRLKRLYDWWEYEPEYDLDWFLDNVGNDTRWTAAQYVAFEILGIDNADRKPEQAEAFWLLALDGAVVLEVAGDYLEGFIKGAVELFAEVADAL